MVTRETGAACELQEDGRQSDDGQNRLDLLQAVRPANASHETVAVWTAGTSGSSVQVSEEARSEAGGSRWSGGNGQRCELRDVVIFWGRLADLGQSFERFWSVALVGVGCRHGLGIIEPAR